MAHDEACRCTNTTTRAKLIDAVAQLSQRADMLRRVAATHATMAELTPCAAAPTGNALARWAARHKLAAGRLHAAMRAMTTTAAAAATITTTPASDAATKQRVREAVLQRDESRVQAAALVSVQSLFNIPV